MSLWQGVDVPGNSCILVAIDRIPFPRPDEPVMSARAAQADAKGGSGFMQVSLPRAALLLAQGTGRLIRSVDDRGVVAILDSRIVTKRYGSVLLTRCHRCGAHLMRPLLETHLDDLPKA
jgi:ATP-dependent DNA helicase DinG